MLSNQETVNLMNTFERGKTVALYQEDKSIVDTTTGEILKESHNTVQKTSTEPDFIKIYYQTMLAFNGIHDIPLEIILAIANYVSWSNEGSPLLFRNDKFTKEQICKICDIKESMYTKYLARCKEQCILFPTKYRGVFEVNPFFIARGKWDSIKKLRTEFCFTDGTWIRKETHDIDG